MGTPGKPACDALGQADEITSSAIGMAGLSSSQQQINCRDFARGALCSMPALIET
jgi:hypothetical protein